jgi:hypothetical protein
MLGSVKLKNRHEISVHSKVDWVIVLDMIAHISSMAMYCRIPFLFCGPMVTTFIVVPVVLWTNDEECSLMQSCISSGCLSG